MVLGFEASNRYCRRIAERQGRRAGKPRLRTKVIKPLTEVRPKLTRTQPTKCENIGHVSVTVQESIRPQCSGMMCAIRFVPGRDACCRCLSIDTCTTDPCTSPWYSPDALSRLSVGPVPVGRWSPKRQLGAAAMTCSSEWEWQPSRRHGATHFERSTVVRKDRLGLNNE